MYLIKSLAKNQIRIVLISSLIFDKIFIVIFDIDNSIIKGSLDEKLPIYEQDPKSKRLDSFEKRFGRDYRFV